MSVIDVVGAALLDDLVRPTRLLAARRLDGEHGWELPGGKVEPGESWDDALLRELDEELGVAVALGPVVPGPMPDGRWPLGSSYAMAVRLAVVTSGIAAPTDSHDEVRWLERSQLYDVAWLPGDLPVVAAVDALMHG